MSRVKIDLKRWHYSKTTCLQRDATNKNILNEGFGISQNVGEAK